MYIKVQEAAKRWPSINQRTQSPDPTRDKLNRQPSLYYDGELKSVELRARMSLDLARPPASPGLILWYIMMIIQPASSTCWTKSRYPTFHTACR